MIYQLVEGQLDPPADSRLVDELSSILGLPLPHDYLNFLKQHDGGEGFIGNSYVVFWRTSELADFNREYEVNRYAPGIFLFGSNGGGEGYGFDMESSELPVIQVPFIGMDRRLAERVASTFQDFFIQLSLLP